jgi:hypothetical protein
MSLREPPGPALGDGSGQRGLRVLLGARDALAVALHEVDPALAQRMRVLQLAAPRAARSTRRDAAMRASPWRCHIR